MVRLLVQWCFLVALVGISAGQTCRAETILGPAPSGTIASYYNRFTNGYQDNPASTVNNPTFYLSGLNFSGVGWRNIGGGSGAAWNVTMIDNIHFIGNWHVGASVALGDTINFRPSTNPTGIVTRTVANLQQVTNLGFSGSGIPDGSPSDVMLGTLSSALLPGDGIASYPIVSAAALGFGQTAFLYGRESAVGQNDIYPAGVVAADVGTGVTISIRMDYDQPNSNPDTIASLVGVNEAHYTGGDSGGPTFVMVGGQLQLLGGNMFIQSYTDGGGTVPPGVSDPVTYSGATFLPAYVTQINALIAVPEPSSLALISVACVGAFARYRRSRRPATT